MLALSNNVGNKKAQHAPCELVPIWWVWWVGIITLVVEGWKKLMVCGWVWRERVREMEAPRWSGRTGEAAVFIRRSSPGRREADVNINSIACGWVIVCV